MDSATSELTHRATTFRQLLSQSAHSALPAPPSTGAPSGLPLHSLPSTTARSRRACHPANTTTGVFSPTYPSRLLPTVHPTLPPPPTAPPPIYAVNDRLFATTCLALRTLRYCVAAGTLPPARTPLPLPYTRIRVLRWLFAVAVNRTYLLPATGATLLPLPVLPVPAYRVLRLHDLPTADGTRTAFNDLRDASTQTAWMHLLVTAGFLHRYARFHNVAATHSALLPHALLGSSCYT